MPSAARALILIAATTGIAACHKPTPPTANQEMTIDDNVAAGQIPPDAQIVTLPPDESSGTSSRELAKGDDNPDVNDLNASSNSH
jgi:hypothetical protein